MRSIATARKTPTPTETLTIITVFSMSGTCCARICKSGSAIVTMTPITKLTNAISQIFLLRVSAEPTFCPMTSIDISAPSVNTAVPAMSSTTPIANSRKVPDSRGVSVSESPSTIRAMGNTARNASPSFSLSASAMPLRRSLTFSLFMVRFPFPRSARVLPFPRADRDDFEKQPFLRQMAEKRLFNMPTVGFGPGFNPGKPGFNLLFPVSWRLRCPRTVRTDCRIPQRPRP